MIPELFDQVMISSLLFEKYGEKISAYEGMIFVCIAINVKNCAYGAL